MAKPSSVRKVAKAARTGGGRTTRGTTSWVFPTLLTVVAITGVFLIGFSRAQRNPDTSPPRVGADHWHSAIGFNICGAFAPPIPDNGQDPLGIHSHGDGVIHTHPFSSQAAGNRARLKLWLETVGVELTETELKLPGQEAKKNGMKCEDKSATLRMKVWDSRARSDEGQIFEGDPGELRLGDSQLITVAFVPEGTDIPRPPTEVELDRLTDVPGATTTSVPGAEATIPPPGTETTTPAPGAETTIPAPGAETSTTNPNPATADPTATAPTTAATPTSVP